MVRPDVIIRSRRKTLSISIDSFGRLIVRAPYDCSEERIFAFLNEKERWILQKQFEKAGAGMRLPPEDLDGYEFMLLGKNCRITLVKKRKISFDSEDRRVYLPIKNSRERLVTWLKANAKRIFTAVTEQKAQEMGVTFKSVTITSAKTRWGSCAYDNAIRYSFRLLYAPKDVIEYIVVHELAHTLHKDHSPAFWAEVEKYLPDYKAKRKWLEVHGILMEIF